MSTERSVLQVLPHPGSGGEGYVDLLEAMPGYHFARAYLAPSPKPSLVELARGVTRAYRCGRDYDLVHVHGDVAAMLCMPLLAGRPSVVTFHGLHLARRLVGLRYRAVRLALRAVVRMTNRTICVCQAELDRLRVICGPGTARRAVVIHNGVPMPEALSAAERAQVRAELGIDEGDPTAIWVGSLDERKDPLSAIAAARSASVTLLVVGDGPLRDQVERHAGRAIHVLGQRSDVRRLLAASDMFVQTSHGEGFALSLLEAMAAGLASIVTDLPENLEAIGDGGIGVAPDDDSLETALRRLANDSVERAELGRRASQRATRLFTAKEMTRRTRALYDDALGIEAAT